MAKFKSDLIKLKYNFHENAKTRLLITAGRVSIVKATTKVLLNAYTRVVITIRDEKKLQNVVQELGVMYVTADVAVPADIDKTFDEVNNQLGGLDVLANYAIVGE